MDQRSSRTNYSLFIINYSLLKEFFTEMEKGRTLVVYAARHGQTIFNLTDRVQGICDSLLTKNGIAGAVNMGTGLRDVPFRAVYASDLRRASETARLAMAQNRATASWTVIEKPELREVGFGIFEGGPNQAMHTAFANHLGLTLPDDTHERPFASFVRYYGGDAQKCMEGLADFNKKIDAESEYQTAESASEVYARLQKGMDALVAENPGGGNVLLVTHGAALSFLLAMIGCNVALAEGGSSGPLGNASVTRIVYDYAAKTYRLDGPPGDMRYAEAGARFQSDKR
jgi:probable phosphoglycerate mutase